MTREETIALAVEAGFHSAEADCHYERLQAFATRVAEREREACIKDCMSNISPQMMAEGDWPAEAAEMVMFCIADIRKRDK